MVEFSCKGFMIEGSIQRRKMGLGSGSGKGGCVEGIVGASVVRGIINGLQSRVSMVGNWEIRRAVENWSFISRCKEAKWAGDQVFGPTICAACILSA